MKIRKIRVQKKPQRRTQPNFALNAKKRTLSYYALIDSGNLPAIFRLFSRSIFYMRGKRKIKGLAQLKEFYKNVRNINGKHKILNMAISGYHVAVEGRFTGANPKGKIDFYFSDHFWFNKNGLIIRRQSILHGFDE